MTSKTGNNANTRHVKAEPMDWVSRWLAAMPAGSDLLDLAAGSGRHSLLASRAGMRVTAADRNEQALASVAQTDAAIQTICTDLEGSDWPFLPGTFDVVVVTNYLFRPRLALLCGLLRPGGRLIYATFALGNERYGKPSNPDYLLRPGELADVARRGGLTVLAYEHGLTGISTGNPAVVQRLCAVRDAGTPGSPKAADNADDTASRDRMMLLDKWQP